MLFKDLSGNTTGNIIGTEANDFLFATSFSDANDDILQGLQGNDVIAGSKGNDVVLGGEGDDTLSGANLRGTEVFTLGGGLFGQDTLTGEQGMDRFVLGGTLEEDNGLDEYLDSTGNSFILTSLDLLEDPTPNNYYDAAGNDDYALITDFNQAEDIIQLDGSRNSYNLGTSPAGLPPGIGIFHQEELIAIVQGEEALDLNAGYFQDSVV